MRLSLRLLPLTCLLLLTTLTGCATVQGWLAPHAEPREAQTHASAVVDSDVRNCDAGNAHCNTATVLGARVRRLPGPLKREVP